MSNATGWSRHTERISLSGPANLIRFEDFKPQRDGITFFSLPAEVRNMVYSFALGIGQPCVPVPAHRSSKETINTRCKLFSLCRQIGFESGSLFLEQGLAYIPIITPMSFNHALVKLCSEQHALVARNITTSISALADMQNAHLHLHVGSVDRYRGRALLLNLYTAVRLWRLNSESSRHVAKGKRRAVTVHLDHFFADNWKGDMPQSMPLWSIIVQMGKDKFTDWTLAYYIHAGYEETINLEGVWYKDRMDEFTELEIKCYGWDNIRIRPEVYGLGKWQELVWPPTFTELVKTDIASQSSLWPLYPGHLHGMWRSQERRAFPGYRSSST